MQRVTCHSCMVSGLGMPTKRVPESSLFYKKIDMNTEGVLVSFELSAANKAIVDLREERTRGKRLNALIAEYAVLKMASNFQKTEK